MNVLLIYPKYPPTFWSFKYALEFINKKASLPPLGLLTVSSMLPAEWNKKLIDLNVSELTDDDIIQADYVLISGMVVQRNSAREIIERARSFNKFIVAGGPLFTKEHSEFGGVDCFALNEGEITIPEFLHDLKAGKLKKIYSSDIKPSLSLTPIPDWSLINPQDYASMSIQVSRGCPFNCDFCDIVILNGKKPRYKSPAQVVSELDAINAMRWKSNLFIVDDNFIGNYSKAKEILRAIVKWMDENSRPFTLSTESTITLADNEELLDLMKKANFSQVFVGIETPDEVGLRSCGKKHNTNGNMIEKIKILQRNGFEVQGGFILGFDSDTNNIFDNMINFIQKSGVVTAMVGMLHALPGTKLHEKLKNENRLLDEATGDNTDFTLNFKPIMSIDQLLEGYKKVQKSIFNPRAFYSRVRTFLKEYKKTASAKNLPFKLQITALSKVFVKLGLIDEGRFDFWKLFIWTIFNKPRYLEIAITTSIYGYHFRKAMLQNI